MATAHPERGAADYPSSRRMGRPENLENYQEWKSWSQAKKTLLLNELDTAKEEAKQARRAGNKDKACVFFIGEQKADRLETFYAVILAWTARLLATLSIWSMNWQYHETYRTSLVLVTSHVSSVVVKEAPTKKVEPTLVRRNEIKEKGSRHPIAYLVVCWKSQMKNPT